MIPRGLFICIYLLLGLSNQAQQFIENKGQWPDHVLFRAEIPEGHIYIEKVGITFDIRDVEQWSSISEAHHGHSAFPERLNFHAYHMEFLGIETLDIQTTTNSSTSYNFFRGNDPSEWGSDCRAVQEILCSNLWEKIDLRLYFVDGQFKYDLIVHPSGDPSDIKFRYKGIDPDVENGQLRFDTDFTTFFESRPYL
ncbi:MAG: hypothetical protein HKN79_09555, partial [Flavobacteriales bacterium]|nr:hypothetical protein [Flavobacteriales bacterium]